MNIVFMGTPDFAVPSLKALIDEFGVKAVYTQPDRPKGRGKKLSMTPIKELALEHNIEVFQPNSLRKEPEAVEVLKALKPDFIIVVAFGQILPKEVLDIPKYACINLHGSLLPKYRGAAPIQWSVINGEKMAGNTTMLMDVGLDTGDMLLTNEVEITRFMTAGELYDELKESGAKLLVETINKMVENEITPIKQNDEESTYASMLNKEMAKIDWDKPAQVIHNHIRGLSPWPIATMNLGDKIIKVHASDFEDEKSDKEPGTIVEATKNGIKVATKDGLLVIKKLQMPNAKPLMVQDFLNGNTIEVGTKLS
ncbi:methionyl-tRNA formyltransferase [uncultured Clostridium sp.]|jgi:methionyl-tRNA formyltransferase|uniref:methionyl-tRNA formyltransferase n=1 Tax=uncultured Clostridium sp. TaxID=59620 RepID=UPI002619BFC1|nr:methionyl-tRNA formyltransferase [uncultured Clostridium sp.]